MRDAFEQIHGKKLEVTIATKGAKKILLDKAIDAAKEGLKQKIKHEGVSRAIYEEMMDLFHLKVLPERIEIYDNSHIMGTSAIGAYVVATPNGFNKREYRAYNVANKIGDDYAMLREVLTRRLGKLLMARKSVIASERSERGNPVTDSVCHHDVLHHEKWIASSDVRPPRNDVKIPDLLLIDGGKGQLSTAMQVMSELGLDIPIVAIAKGPDRNAGKEVFYLPSGEELTFDRNKPLMKYLQILRDEAHKFAITSHRKKRAKAMGASSLDDIADIGPARKKALLAHFGSLEAIKSASLQEIAKVPGISVAIAQKIKGSF